MVLGFFSETSRPIDIILALVERSVGIKELSWQIPADFGTAETLGWD